MLGKPSNVGNMRGRPRVVKLISHEIGKIFSSFEKQSFPIFVCSKSCNSVITHPSTRPHELFRIHVVLLEIPYPQMFFLRDEDVRLGTN